MTSLSLPCIAAAALYIGWNYYWARLEHRLRTQPRPRVWLKLSLGRGMKDSDKKMLRFLRTYAGELQASGQDRRRGARQLRLLTVATREHTDAQPVPRFYVGCDPDTAEAVRSALREQFGSKLAIQQVDDPLQAFRTPDATNPAS